MSIFKLTSATVSTFPKISTIDKIAAADFNGDGAIDVAAAVIDYSSIGAKTSPFIVFTGDTNGKFKQSTSVFASGSNPITSYVPRLEVNDFNNDNVADILAIDSGMDTYPFPGGKNLLLLSSSGKLEDKSSWLPRELLFTHDASTGDLNGDGKVDIVNNVLGITGNQILLNNGAGFTQAKSPTTWFNSSQLWNYSAGTLPLTHTTSAIIDINADGQNDILLGKWGNETSSASSFVALNNNGDFSKSVLLPSPPISNFVVLDIKPIDLNGDQNIDLVLSITNDGDLNTFYKLPYLQLLANNGNGTFTDETQIRYPQSLQLTSQTSWYKEVIPTDLNLDGYTDLVLDDRANSPKVLLNNRNGTFVKVDDFSNLVRGNATVTVADVNQNGLDDMISTFDYGTNTSIVTLFNTSNSSIKDLPVVAPINGKVTSTVKEGDYGLYPEQFVFSLEGLSIQKPIPVKFTTRAGTANPWEDYVPVSGEFILTPGTKELSGAISIIGDRIYEPPETFYVDLIAQDGSVFEPGVIKLTTQFSII